MQHQNFQKLLGVLLEYFPLAPEIKIELHGENGMALGLRLPSMTACHVIFEICEDFLQQTLF